MAGQVTVTLNSGEQVAGFLFAVDPVTKALLVQHEDGRFTMVNAQHVSGVEGDSTVPSPDVAALGISLGGMEKREAAALAAAEKSLDSINLNVSPMQQNLFEKVASVFSATKWVGNQIVILDNVVVDPPYREAKIAGGGANTQLAFVQKVLQGAREKLGMAD